MTTRYCFIGACPELTGPFVNYVRGQHGNFGHVRDITYRTFASYMEPGFLREWKARYGFALSQNWDVCFHKSRTPSGLPALYFCWSAMEHVFLPCRRLRDFDLEEETKLAQAAEDEANYREQGGRLRKLGIISADLHVDGTITLFHGTDPANVEDIVKGRRLLASDDGYAYLTTDPHAARAYGPAVLAVDVYPTQLESDPHFGLLRDAGWKDFPGRRDFRIAGSYGGIAYIVRARPV